jgi:DNA-binding CsgD family transcriptional regulator
MDTRNVEVKLTPTEIKVLRSMKDCYGVSDAAKRLFKSACTVRAHLQNMREKTGLHRTHQLLMWAAKRGLLEDPPDRTVGAGNHTAEAVAWIQMNSQPNSLASKYHSHSFN